MFWETHTTSAALSLDTLFRLAVRTFEYQLNDRSTATLVTSNHKILQAILFSSLQPQYSFHQAIGKIVETFFHINTFSKNPSLAE